MALFFVSQAFMIPKKHYKKRWIEGYTFDKFAETVALTDERQERKVLGFFVIEWLVVSVQGLV